MEKESPEFLLSFLNSMVFLSHHPKSKAEKVRNDAKIADISERLVKALKVQPWTEIEEVKVIYVDK